MNKPYHLGWVLGHLRRTKR